MVVTEEQEEDSFPSVWMGALHFAKYYDADEDLYIFVPIDEDGEEWDDHALAIDSHAAQSYLLMIAEAISSLSKVRRIIRKAKQKRANLDVVMGRLSDSAIVDDLDQMLRRGRPLT